MELQSDKENQEPLGLHRRVRVHIFTVNGVSDKIPREAEVLIWGESKAINKGSLC